MVTLFQWRRSISKEYLLKSNKRGVKRCKGTNSIFVVMKKDDHNRRVSQRMRNTCNPKSGTYLFEAIKPADFFLISSTRMIPLLFPIFLYDQLSIILLFLLFFYPSLSSSFFSLSFPFLPPVPISKENSHIASTISKKEITFVNQVFNATDNYLRTRACSSNFCVHKWPDECTDKDRTHNMIIKRYKIDCEFHESRLPPPSLPPPPRSSMDDGGRRSRFRSREVRSAVMRNVNSWIDGVRAVSRFSGDEARFHGGSVLYARITWAVRSVNIHVKKTSVPLKVECKSIKRIKYSKRYIRLSPYA